MKGKITGIILCMTLLCMSLLSGCGLIKVDVEKYYGSVIATIEDENGKVIDTISSKELIEAYQSQGYYYEYNGMSRKEAVRETITLLENRKITIRKAEEKYDIDITGKNLTALEKTYLWEKTTETLNSNLKYYYEEIVGKKADEEESDEVKFNGYDQKIRLVSKPYDKDFDGVMDSYIYDIEKLEFEDDVLSDYVQTVSDKDFNKTEDRELIYTNLLESLDNDNYLKAFNKYFKGLKADEKGLGLSTDAKSVFDREIESLYKANYESYVIQRYQKDILAQSEATPITTQDLLNLYSSKVREDYTKYELEQSSKYTDDMKSSFKDVYYYSQKQDETRYFTVANILFSLSEEDQATLKGYKTKLDQNLPSYDEEDYKKDADALYDAKTELVVRKKNAETGVYEEQTLTDSGEQLSNGQKINRVIDREIKQALSNAQMTGNVNTIGDLINDLIYRYNTDPGMFNAESNYVIGVDKDGEAVSSFVESFNEAGLKLYNNGQGKIGDVEIAYSEYGIHVLIYTGECQNLFTGIDYDFSLSGNYVSQGTDKSALELLNSTRINPLVQKTYLDALYDELYKDNSSAFQEMHIDTLRKDYTFTVYNGRIPSVLKG